MEMKNVLVFPCGTEIGLEINNALRFVKFINLFGASSEDDNGRMVYKNYIPGIPYITDDSFIKKINEIVEKYKIDYIFPAHDSVVLELAKHANEIKAEIITSSYDTCLICRSKYKTYKLFEEDNIIPHIYEEIEDVNEYPVFIKPDVGQGSNGASLIHDKDELCVKIKERNEKMLILEYLPGKEYTVDCFTDKNGKLLHCSMRQRIRTRNGISVNSKTMETDSRVTEIANIINNKLRFRGAWFFQVKYDIKNEFKLLEVAPRIAGTMCLHRNLGANFELMSIYDRMGYDISINTNDYELEVERALINRFIIKYEYANVYIDFDDTITNKGTVNEFTMLFLYQCLNKGKKIILITKHKDIIEQSLKKYKICIDIFDEIISIEQCDKKKEYISNNSIFIDDSYSERKDVHDSIGIPCFDVDQIESLIDWRK